MVHKVEFIIQTMILQEVQKCQEISLLILMTGGGLVWKLVPGQNKGRDLTSYTVEAQEGKLPSLITASGELKAKRSVNVSPERRGLLEALFVKEGEKVEKGQLLAKMKSGDYLYRLNELKAEYEKSKLDITDTSSPNSPSTSSPPDET